jgi:hypothetical protein
MTRTTRAALALAATAAVAGPTAAAAQAKPRKVTGGQSVVTLSSAAASALAAAGVTVSAVAPATAGDAGIAIPVVRGTVKPKHNAGVVRHKGGVQLSSSTRTVRLRAPIVVNTKGRHFMAVKVGRRTIRAFTLVHRQRSGQGASTVLSADLALTGKAARLLNRAFGTSFQTGQVAGSGTMTLTTAAKR